MCIRDSYYTIDGNVEITEEFLAQVKAYMRELVERKIPILKRSVGTSEAIEIFHEHGMYDKEKLFRFRRVSRVNIYSLDAVSYTHLILVKTQRKCWNWQTGKTKDLVSV